MTRIITDDSGSRRSVKPTEKSPEVIHVNDALDDGAVLGLERHQPRDRRQRHRERDQHRAAGDRAGRGLR